MCEGERGREQRGGRGEDESKEWGEIEDDSKEWGDTDDESKERGGRG